MVKQRNPGNSDKRTVLGFTLTKRGWNNVLIYVVLIIMFIFYFIGHDSGRIARGELFQPFVDRTLVELADRNYRVVRVGNRWQQDAGEPLSDATISRWREGWQELTLEVYDGLLEGREYSVEVSFADFPEPQAIGVFYSRHGLLVALPGADQVFRVVEQSPGILNPDDAQR
ncbi:MAG: hypothetical protein JJU10_06065 [Idiomarina sp.]|nr:hypothetical protein [Idiomarina sp.]